MASMEPPRKKARVEESATKEKKSGKKKKGKKKKERLMDPVRVHLPSTHDRSAVFKHGNFQVPPNMTVEPPAHVHAPPTREYQNGQTLMPPQVRSMGSLLAETKSWADQPPLDVLRYLYSPELFKEAVRIRSEGHRTLMPPRVMAAVEHLAGSPVRAASAAAAENDTAEFMEVVEEGRILDVDTQRALMPPLLDVVRQTKSKTTSARPVRIMDPQMGTLLPPKQDNTKTTTTTTTTTQTTPLTIPPQLSLVQPMLENDVGTKQNKRARLLFHTRRHESLLLYYKSDPEPDPDLGFGLNPQSYPMFRCFFNELRPLWEQRVELNNKAAEHMPRPQVEKIDQERRQKYRQPCNLKLQLPCSRETECIVCVLARQEGQPKWGYKLPKFLTYDEEIIHNARRAAGIPLSEDKPGPCLECIEYSITQQVLYNDLHHATPSVILNKYMVHVGVGGYAREVIIKEKIDGIKAPIAGHFPIWDASYRQFDPLPGGTADQMILREVNMDFRLSLSQTNACLGARKSRPLAGNNGASTASLPRDMCLDDPVTVQFGNVLPQAWVHFISTAPTAVMADRALILTPSRRAKAAAQGCGVGTQESMVPAVWLRLFLRLDTPDASHQLFEQIIRDRLSPSMVADLLAILSTHEENNLYRSEADCRKDLATLLFTIANAVFTTYERSFAQLELLEPMLNTILEHVLGLHKSTPFPWIRETMGHHFNGFPKQIPSDPSKTRVWRTAMARTVGALLFLHVIHPWPAYQAATFGNAFAKHALYFVDTHLSILVTTALMATSTLPGCRQCIFENSDSYWLTPAVNHGDCRLTAHYPNCTRVVCAEELPDLTPMMFSTNFWYDLPSKKTHTSLLFALIHILSKVLNNVCQRRNFNGIIVGMMRTYPVIHNIICLILEVSLLGNMPAATSRLPLAARMRIHATFSWNPALDVNERKERIYTWIMEHPLVTMALLREYMFYCVESNGPIDILRGLSGNWQRYKAMSRQLHGQIRRHLSSQVAIHGMRGRINWDAIERPKGKTTVGEVLRWHEKQKAYNVKLRKDTEIGLLLKKARSLEKNFVVTQEDIDWLKAEDRYEALHVFCWQAARERHMARDEDGAIRTMVKTGFLKFYMTETSFRELREWLHLSVEYVFPDDGIKKLLIRMQRRSTRDFLVFKNAWLLIEHYSNELMSFRPIDEMRFLQTSLRFNIKVPKDVATQPKLGYAYYCEGCLKWGNNVVEISSELVDMPPPHVAIPRKRRRRPLRVTANAPTPPPPAPSTNNHNKKKREKPPRPWAPRPCYVADGRAPCVNNLYFNMVQARLYCKRANFLAESVAAYKAMRQAQIGHREEVIDAMDIDTPPAPISDAELMDLLPSSESSSEDSEDEESDSESSSEETDASRVVRGQFDLSLSAEPPCNHPVIPVDLVGVYRWLGDHMMGLCVYCGRFAEVLAVNMTNRGLSCGEHAFPDEYAKNHRIWRHIQRPKDPPTPLYNPAGDVPCIVCGRCEDSAQLVDTTDHDGRLFQVAVCSADLLFSKGLVWRGKFSVMPPIPLKLLFTTIENTLRG